VAPYFLTGLLDFLSLLIRVDGRGDSTSGDSSLSTKGREGGAQISKSGIVLLFSTIKNKI
jgi:hypothetical protein